MEGKLSYPFLRAVIVQQTANDTCTHLTTHTGKRVLSLGLVSDCV